MSTARWTNHRFISDIIRSAHVSSSHLWHCGHQLADFLTPFTNPGQARPGQASIYPVNHPASHSHSLRAVEEDGLVIGTWLHSTGCIRFASTHMYVCTHRYTLHVQYMVTHRNTHTHTHTRHWNTFTLSLNRLPFNWCHKFHHVTRPCKSNTTCLVSECKFIWMILTGTKIPPAMWTDSVA